jgi:hypothetical protein
MSDINIQIKGKNIDLTTTQPSSTGNPVTEVDDKLDLTVLRGEQGPPGSGTEEAAFSATEDIPAFVIVTIDGHRADSNNPVSDRGRVIGITEEAVQSGFVGNALTGGEITNPLWNWTPGAKLFLNGQNLSTVAPSTGFSQFIGVARTATTIMIQLGDPILL